MPIVKITGQGLSAIALAVALLWGCWLAERSLTRQAALDRARVLHEIHRLQRRPVNTTVPGLFHPHHPVTAG